MGRTIQLFAASLITISFATPAAADDPPTMLEPSSQWNVDFAPNKCRLARTFGEGENQHLLFFEQHFPDDSAGLTVAGPSFERFKSRKRTYLSFFPEQDSLRTEPFAGDVDSVGSAIIYSSVNLASGTADDDDDPATLPQLDTAFAGKAQYVALRQSGRSVAFNTGPLDEPFAVLNLCTQSLVKDWGLNVEKHMTSQARPKWENESKVVRQIVSKYPGAALSRGEQGIMRMRVMIDETGAVTDCVINEATTADQLKSPACNAMTKAKFSPALDAQGQPFKSYYATSIIYQMGR